jgi:hypothetical protein
MKTPRTPLLSSLIVAFAWLNPSLTAYASESPSLQPLLQNKWPQDTRGRAMDVQVVGNYAYVAFAGGGMVVVDVQNRETGGGQPLNYNLALPSLRLDSDSLRRGSVPHFRIFRPA